LVIAADVKEKFVWEKNGIKVTPFTVRHAEFIDSALGYRIDYCLSPLMSWTKFRK